MKLCNNCGFNVDDSAVFCSKCGAKLSEMNVPPVHNVEPVLSEEQESLTMTYRILRWERKAWSIGGKVLIIVGIVFAVLFSFLALVFAAIGNMAPLAVMYFMFSGIYGGMFIALGVISNIAAGKITPYLDAFHIDQRPAITRCGSVGMLIFSIFCGSVAFVFFLINFIRIKSSSRIVNSIFMGK